MVTIDKDSRAAHRTAAGHEWLAVGGYRQAEDAENPVCRTEYYINRSFAAVGRMLHRHTGPIFPLIEDLFGVSIIEVHQEIAAVPIRDLAAGLQITAAARPLRFGAPTPPPTVRSPR